MVMGDLISETLVTKIEVFQILIGKSKKRNVQGFYEYQRVVYKLDL